MATRTMPNFIPKGNEELPIHVEFLAEGVPAVSSLHVARHFQKKHQHILRDIDKICSISPISFAASNFGRSTYQDVTGRTLPCYLLSRDAFSLLVMGFTGKAAIQWKLRYIEAFNSLEAAVLQNQTELAREAGYAQGLEAAAPVLRSATAGIWNLSKNDKAKVRRVTRYKKMGLNSGDIAKLLDVQKRKVDAYLSAAKHMGFLS